MAGIVWYTRSRVFSLFNGFWYSMITLWAAGITDFVDQQLGCCQVAIHWWEKIACCNKESWELLNGRDKRSSLAYELVNELWLSNVSWKIQGWIHWMLLFSTWLTAVPCHSFSCIILAQDYITAFLLMSLFKDILSIIYLFISNYYFNFIFNFDSETPDSSN